MPEDTQVPETSGSAPAEAPAQLTEDRILELVTKAFDARIPGLQSSFSKQVNEIGQRVDDIRRASLGDDEIEQEDTNKYKAEAEAANRRAALAEAALKYPRGAEIYGQIMQADDTEAQIAFLESFQSAPAPEAGDPDEDENDEPAAGSVDSNNPIRDPDPGQQFKSEEQALSFLDRLPSWPKA